MSCQPTLTGMPEEILSPILDECGFCDIQSLRKVCHHLRNLIDDTPPDPKLTEIEMVMNPEDTVVYYHKDEKTYRIIYENQENGCKIHWKTREKWIPGAENSALAFRDLALILKGQDTILTKFRLIWTEKGSKNGENHLMECLNSKKSPLKVQKLHLEPSSSAQILGILQFLDPKILRKIEIYSNLFTDFSGNLVKLEQWKRVKEVFVYNCLKFESILDFSNFDEAMACLEEFKLQEMVGLMETFFHHPHFKSLYFHFKNLSDWEKFTNFAGHPAKSTDFETIWYFGCSDSEWILKVTKDEMNGNDVEFKRIGKAENEMEEGKITDFVVFF